jgi:hypothetical protein
VRIKSLLGPESELNNEFREQFSAWADDLESLRQNRLLSESNFLTFTRERGVPVCGVCSGEPSDFSNRGWLPFDGQYDDGTRLYHPFRIYALYFLLEACDLHISKVSSLHPKEMLSLVAQVLENCIPNDTAFQQLADGYNRVVDLAILLEPIYWPSISGWTSSSAWLTEDARNARLAEYKEKVRKLLLLLDPEEWKKIHERLRHQSAIIDDNDDLYLLLRLSRWNRRERLKGKIALALWIRHIAEVIRLGFADICAEKWDEEDQAFGMWHPGGRKSFYGTDRPIQNASIARPYLAFYFGFFTGSVVRWYVEGETEYYAIAEVLPSAPIEGIELINLRGSIASEKQNAPLKLKDLLEEDLKLRRFSIISFDRDVPANVRTIRKMIEAEKIVGLVAAHQPDFEFQNFSLTELVEVIARIEIQAGGDPEVIHGVDWTGIQSGKALDDRYMSIVSRKYPNLKGERWGRALAAYAQEFPNLPDHPDTFRPFWNEIGAALRSKMASYDMQKETYRFNLQTFEAMKKTETD